eukprot:5802338-Pyramimonas_sp.AAC.1
MASQRRVNCATQTAAPRGRRRLDLQLRLRLHPTSFRLSSSFRSGLGLRFGFDLGAESLAQRRGDVARRGGPSNCWPVHRRGLRELQRHGVAAP